MASIVKRKNKFSVVYTYTDDKGDKRQNGKPLRPTLKPKDVKRKSSSNKSQVLLLFLKQRP